MKVTGIIAAIALALASGSTATAQHDDHHPGGRDNGGGPEVSGCGCSMSMCGETSEGEGGGATCEMMSAGEGNGGHGDMMKDHHEANGDMMLDHHAANGDMMKDHHDASGGGEMRGMGCQASSGPNEQRCRRMKTRGNGMMSRGTMIMMPTLK